MSQGNLESIRLMTRELTGRDPSQMPDSEIDDRINDYYQIDMPANLRILKLKDFYIFNTQPNIDVYKFDDVDYFYVEPQAEVDGYNCFLTTEPTTFFNQLPRAQIHQIIGQGNGTQGPFTGTLNAMPVYRSYNMQNLNGEFPNDYNIGINQMVMFNAKMSGELPGNGSLAQVVVDSPNVITDPAYLPIFNPPISTATGTRYLDTGTLIGEVAAGSNSFINYITGQYSVTFSRPVPQGMNVEAVYTTYAPTRPSSMLFFQDQFYLGNPPDRVYKVKLTVYRRPSALINSTDKPELQELWQLLAFGAAQKIFERNADWGQWNDIQPALKKYEQICMARSMLQNAATRIETIYSIGGGSFSAANQPTTWY